jgi:hypothetical protein
VREVTVAAVGVQEVAIRLRRRRRRIAFCISVLILFQLSHRAAPRRGLSASGPLLTNFDSRNFVSPIHFRLSMSLLPVCRPPVPCPVQQLSCSVWLMFHHGALSGGALWQFVGVAFPLISDPGSGAFAADAAARLLPLRRHCQEHGCLPTPAFRATRPVFKRDSS